MMTNTYVTQQRELATAWKAGTTVLPIEARATAPWINQKGQPVGHYGFCLPSVSAEHNLLPAVRSGARSLFTELGIPWHAGIADGPGNHLLSSQVQCVNALYAMVAEPGRLIAAFGDSLDIGEVLEIEPGRHLTFEYIGPTDFFGEAPEGQRIRGTHCTSLDAAFLYRTTGGVIELALVEWKYTESYQTTRTPSPDKDVTRAGRYLEDYQAANGPLDSEAMAFDLMLDEPFYQLMRQQLLAHRLEGVHAHGAEVVRVVHVLAQANTAYQSSLVRPEHRAAGDTVDAVWSRLLRHNDRFIHLDPAVFLDEPVTSPEYVARYATPHAAGASAAITTASATTGK
jgi:hypothetical protein